MDRPEAVTISNGHVVLPTNVKPTHYDLKVEPNLELSTFTGRVIIDLDIVQDTTSISLNAAGLDIVETQLHSDSQSLLIEPELQHDKERQTVTTILRDTLSAGSKARLTHVFKGALTDQLTGYYRSLYTGRDGQQKYMATTLFEPTYARMAFPCFDEPALKARFTVTLLADKGLTCLSNMDVLTEQVVTSEFSDLSKLSVTFNTSPIMSTYLVAYIVGELDMIESNAFRVPVRIYADPSKNIEHGRFALNLAVRALKLFEDTFQCAFPLPKMDLVAIPDFLVSAMENFGLVTFRVSALLLDEVNANSAVKKRVAEVVTHELAHQWFGDLVTMDFWEGLWLNEGFATFMAWFACDHFNPEWKVWEGFMSTTYAEAMELDSLRSSHAVELPIKHAEEIEQLFDKISYFKGACVLRMICHFLGQDGFIRGVCHYINKHAYANARTDDLWASLSEVSGQDIGKLMEVWTRKIGYPVITITEDAEKGSIHVRQNRYLKTADVKPEEDETIYPIVLGLRDRDGKITNSVLDERETTINMPDLGFYKLNANHAGFFRTSYPPDRLVKLGKAALEGLLTVEDRVGVIADAGALAQSGYQKTSSVFTLLQSFRGEREPVVWEAIDNVLSAARRCWLFEDDRVKQAFDRFTLDLARDAFNSVGYSIADDDGLTRREMKKLLFRLATGAGDVDAGKAALDMFERYTRGGDRHAIHPELRDVVFDFALSNGGVREYEAVWNEMSTAKDSAEKDLALTSLGSTRQPELIQRTLNILLSDRIRSGDAYLVPMKLKTHVQGKMAMLAWLKQNWAALDARLRDSIIQLERVVDQMTCGFTTEEHLKQLHEVYQVIDTKPFEMKLAQNLDQCRSNAGWLGRDHEDVQEWLTKNGYMG